MSDEPVFDLQSLNLSVDGKKPRFIPSALRGYRAKVPGGWMVYFWDSPGTGLTFYPDPNHQWDGGSLPQE